MCCPSSFCKDSTLFIPKNTLLELILATSFAGSFDGDSFDLKQARTEAYATCSKMTFLSAQLKITIT